MRSAFLFVVAALIALPVRAQEAAPAASIDRVRTALQQPESKLVLTERKPDFSIEVVWHHPFHEIFDTPPWQLPPHSWQPPGLGFNILSVFQSMAKSIADAKYARDERAARAEVQQAILDYCAAQPDAKGADRICPTAGR